MKELILKLRDDLKEEQKRAREGNLDAQRLVNLKMVFNYLNLHAPGFDEEWDALITSEK